MSYIRTVNGRGAPYLTASLEHDGARVDERSFLVDTGSLFSLAPLHYAVDLCDLLPGPEFRLRKRDCGL